MTIPIPPANRPTVHWRAARTEQAADVAAGRVPADEAFLAELFPDAFLDPCDVLLAEFEAAIAPLGPTDFDAVYAAIEKLVLGLNDLNEEGEGGWIETDERERLCAYIDEVITGAGISVEALAGSRGVGTGEITDEWRDW